MNKYRITFVGSVTYEIEADSGDQALNEAYTLADKVLDDIDDVGIDECGEVQQ